MTASLRAQMWRTHIHRRRSPGLEQPCAVRWQQGNVAFPTVERVPVGHGVTSAGSTSWANEQRLQGRPGQVAQRHSSPERSSVFRT